MKIALLGPSYPYKGGIVQFNYLLAKKLKELYGADAYLYTWHRLYPSFFLPKPEAEFQDHKSKEKIDISDAERFVDYLNPFSWIKLVSKVKRNKVDLFVTNWQQPVQFPVYLGIFLMLRIFTHCKIVVVSHNVQQHESSSISRLLTKIIFKFADRIVVHSRTDLEHAKEIENKNKYIHLYLPLFSTFNANLKYDKTGFIEDIGFEEKNKILLFFGFIRPYKGLEYLFKAIPIVKKEYPEIRLVVAGELFWKKSDKPLTFGQRVKSLPFKILRSVTIKQKVEEYNPLKLIDELNIQNEVVVHDTFIPNEDVPKYFDISDALIAPYISASQSAPVQVAYSLNKPVIASKVGGLIESVEDGVSGYLFESKNPEDLALKISEFYKKGNDFWEGSVSKYKEKFNWDDYVSTIVESVS